MDDVDIILLQAIARLLEWQMHAEELYQSMFADTIEKNKIGEIETSWQWRKYFDHITKKISELEIKND